MYNLKLTRLGLFLAVFFLIACSSNDVDDPSQAKTDDQQATDDTVDPSEAFSILLFSNSSDDVLLVNETVNFSVKKNNGDNVSDEVDFYVNDVKIDSRNYTFPQTGNYQVFAQLNSEKTNALTFSVINANDRVLQLNRENSLKGQEVVFSLVDASGQGTSDATYFVNNNSLSGNAFSSTIAGSYLVYAQYNLNGMLMTSEEKTFEVIVPKRKVLIEDYTATWCGYCTRAFAFIDELRSQTDDIAVIALHVQDDYSHPNVVELMNQFGIDEFPTVMVNRLEEWDGNDMSLPLETAGTASEMAISISSDIIDTRTISVDVNVSSTETLQNKQLVVYLLEDGIIDIQGNLGHYNPSSPYYNLGDPIEIFEHNEVLRHTLTHIFGNPIPTTSALTEYNVNYTKEISSNVNIANLRVLAMVVDVYQSVHNIQTAQVLEYKPYE